jgi:hypothetical protein
VGGAEGPGHPEEQAPREGQDHLEVPEEEVQAVPVAVVVRAA